MVVIVQGNKNSCPDHLLDEIFSYLIISEQ